MHDVRFKRTAPDESRIYVDGDDHVGDVYAMSDPSAAGAASTPSISTRITEARPVCTTARRSARPPRG